MGSGEKWIEVLDREFYLDDVDWNRMVSTGILHVYHDF